jgi:hypothetical protein
MFRVVLPPIIRSAYNCIDSIWYFSHRYCYLPLSWKSWNRFECAVGGVRRTLYNVKQRYWVIGVRRFETTQWSRKVWHQLPSDVSPHPRRRPQIHCCENLKISHLAHTGIRLPDRPARTDWANPALSWIYHSEIYVATCAKNNWNSTG